MKIGSLGSRGGREEISILDPQSRLRHRVCALLVVCLGRRKRKPITLNRPPSLPPVDRMGMGIGSLAEQN